MRGANDTADQTSRNAIASEIDQIIQGIKESANATYGDKYLMSGTATSVAPYKLGADDAYQGNEAGLDPAIPGVIREIGPGVTMSINTVAREILGDGRAATRPTASCSTRCATSPTTCAPATAPRCAAAT